MYRLLIVDDEPVIRAGIRSIIQQSDSMFDVFYECENGEEALLLLEKEQVDLIITDIKMPGMDGLEFIEKCFALFSGTPPTTLVLSGHKDFEYARKAMRFGVQEYLLKPVARADLLEVVARFEQGLASTRPPIPASPMPDASSIEALLLKAADETLQCAIIQVVSTGDGTGNLSPGQLFSALAAQLDFDGKGIFLRTTAPTQCLIIGTLDGMVEEIARFMEHAAPGHYAMGVSAPFSSAEGCPGAEAQARQALKIAWLDPGNTSYTCQADTSAIDNDRLLSAMQYIHDNCGSDLGMAQVANSLSLNYTYFSGMFKARLGTNYSTFLAELRLQKAMYLLRTSDYRIGEIARLVGYQDPKRFTKAFGKKMHVTPMEYRRKLNDG